MVSTIGEVHRPPVTVFDQDGGEYYRMRGTFTMFLVVLTDRSTGQPVDSTYRMCFEGSCKNVEKDAAADGRDVAFIPITINVPDFPKWLNPHRVAGQCEVELEPTSFRLMGGSHDEP
jgi:hypothetical protein